MRREQLEEMKQTARWSKDKPTISRLLEVNGSIVCSHVAANPYASEGILWKVWRIYREFQSVKFELMRNKSTPKEVLDELASIAKDFCDARILLEHPNLSLESIVRLYEDYGEHLDVAKGVIAHPNTSSELLLRIIDEQAELIGDVVEVGVKTGKLKIVKA